MKYIDNDDFEYSDEKQFSSVMNIPDYMFENHDVLMSALDNAYSAEEFLYILHNTPARMFDEQQLINIFESIELPIRLIPEDYLYNKEVALILAEKNHKNTPFLPHFWLDDKDFMFTAIKVNPINYQYASDDLQADHKITMAACSLDGTVLRYVPPQLKSYELVCTALGLRGQVLCPEAYLYIPEKYAYDPEFAIACLTYSHEFFKYLPEEFIYDRDFSLKCVQMYDRLLGEVPANFTADKEFVYDAVSQRGLFLDKAADVLRSDVEFLKPLLQQHPRVIFDCANAIRDNEEIARMVCGQKTRGDAIPFSFFNYKITCNREIALMSATVDVKHTVLHTDRSLLCDKTFIKEIIEMPSYTSEVISGFPYEIRNNRSLMIKALAKDTDLKYVKYVGDNLKYDMKFIGTLLKDTNSFSDRFKNIGEAFQYGVTQLQYVVQISELPELAKMKDMAWQYNNILKRFINKNDDTKALHYAGEEDFYPLLQRYAASYKLKVELEKELPQVSAPIKRVKI